MAPRSPNYPSHTAPRPVVVVAILLLATACERETLLGSNWRPLEPGPDASTTEDAGGPCASGEWQYSDKSCGLDPGGIFKCSEELGDLLCHRRCSSPSDCLDPREPYCRRLGLYKGSEDACKEVVRICSATEEGCP